MKIVDVHTHCFPDHLAERAMEKLTDLSYQKPFHNGTVAGLLNSMDEAGIYKSIVQSIATKPDQVENILNWSIKIKSERIEPFISIHPESKNYIEILKKAKDNGIKGLKVHPHYQGFNADDEKIFFMYETFCKFNLIVLFHSGEDLAFPGCDNASTERMLKVKEKFPEMKIILAHYGAYREWDKVYELLAGKDLYFETSFILEEAGEEMFKKIMGKHSDNKIMFGTDSPWTDQKNAVQLLKNLSISEESKAKIFYKNIENLLNSVSS